MKFSLQLLPLVAFTESGGKCVRRAYQIEIDENNKYKASNPEDEPEYAWDNSFDLRHPQYREGSDDELEYAWDNSFDLRHPQYREGSDDAFESQESVVQTFPEALSTDDVPPRDQAPEVVPKKPEYNAADLIRRTNELISRIDRVFDNTKVLPDLSKETDYQKVARLWKKNEKSILGHLSYAMDTKEVVESMLTSMRTFINSAEKAIDNPGSQLSDSDIGNMLDAVPSLLLGKVTELRSDLIQNKGKFLENSRDIVNLKTISDQSSQKIENLNQKIEKADGKSTEKMIKELTDETNLHQKYQLALIQHAGHMDDALQVLALHIGHEKTRIHERLSFAESEKTQHDEIESKLHDLLNKVTRKRTAFSFRTVESAEESVETERKQEILRKVLVTIVDYLNITEPSFDGQQLRQNVESLRNDADQLIRSLAKIFQILNATPKDTYLIPNRKVLENPRKALEFLKANKVALVSPARHPRENIDAVASRMDVLHIATKLAVRLSNDVSDESKNHENELEKDLVKAQKALTENVSDTKEDIDSWNSFIIQTSKWFEKQSDKVTSGYNSLRKINELKKKLSQYEKLQDSISEFNYEESQSRKTIIGFNNSDKEAMEFSLENPYIKRLEGEAQENIEVILTNLETQKNEMEKPDLAKNDKKAMEKLYESKMNVVKEMVNQLVDAHRA